MPRTTTSDRSFPYYSAFLDLRRKRVVVVGGGEIATGKVTGLLPCGPDPLVVIAPEASWLIQEAAEAGKLIWQRRSYQDGDLVGADLAFAATDDRGLNATVAAEARNRRIPVLAVDDIPNCDLIAPSIVKRGDLTIAFSTNGKSPAFARWLRERFDRDVPAHWGALLAIAGSVRERLGERRRKVRPEQWLEALDELDGALAAGPLPHAEEWLLGRLTGGKGTESLTRTLAQRERGLDGGTDPTPAPPPPKGEGDHAGLVSLVGAGPGDPELLTLGALRRLRAADAVVYDRLIGSEVLGLCRADAEMYDVGKVPGNHACQQSEINDLLIRLGRAGRRVVRLKGGDPFVFGRGGEEALALANAEVPFEIVPGVSAALAVPAVAGIPVTHRGLATSVTIATGHGRGGTGDHDWSALARTRGTLVFLMAVENLEQIVERLLGNGRNPTEPTAIVESGTLPEQRIIRSSLADAAATARAADVKAPAVFVVGPTVELADQIRTETKERLLDVVGSLSPIDILAVERDSCSARPAVNATVRPA
jgi:uroporphyrin-III C-methyltransferase/precorrin-2 dehydrogenase/sirohydrochlorin ferrochelatase